MAEPYVSEADFVCGFLVSEIRAYSREKEKRVELHLEEPVGYGGEHCDLTIRTEGQPSIVVEAKLDREPWNPDVVKQAFNYASGRFPNYCTCSPAKMIVFSSAVQPLNGALEVLYYDDYWVQTLFQVTANKRPTSLYGMLLSRGELDRETAGLFEEVWGLEPESRTSSEGMLPPQFRLFARSGPGITTPRPYGRYRERNVAVQNKALYEGRGFKMSLQERKGDKWIEIDLDQETLDGST